MIHKRKLRLRFRKYPQDQLMRLHRFLEQSQEKNGFAPSIDEVARKFKCHRTTVAHWYRLMVEKKLMERVTGARRAFKLLPPQETQIVEEAA